MDKLALTDEERNSALWQKILAYQNGRLDTLRRSNDNPMDAEKTAAVRGRIAEVKDFIGEIKEKPKHNADGVKYT